jgi:hypothetical protein
VIVETSVGPIELTEEALSLNLRIDQLKWHIKRMGAKLAKASTLEEVKDLLDVLAENREALADIESELERENA